MEEGAAGARLERLGGEGRWGVEEVQRVRVDGEKEGRELKQFRESRKGLLRM